MLAVDVTRTVPKRMEDIKYCSKKLFMVVSHTACSRDFVMWVYSYVSLSARGQEERMHNQKELIFSTGR